MKKLLILSLTIGLLAPMEMTVEAATPAKSSSELTKTAAFKRKRHRGYRQKEGFMWGLFRKKNPCGCPNH